MEIRWIEDIKEFRRISRGWDEAMINSQELNPFLLSDFIISWWENFKDRLELRILICEDAGQIKAGLPLYIKREGIRHGYVRVLKYLGDYAANYTEPLYSDKDTRILPLLEEALRGAKDWDVLILTDIRDKSRFIEELNTRPAKKEFSYNVVQDHVNWAIDISSGLDKYLDSVSSKLRRDLRAKRRHIENKFGKIELKAISGEGEVKRCLDLYRKFSRDAFAARKGKSNFEDEKYSGFFREFLVLMDRSGRLDAHLLTAGKEVLAISFAYRFGRGFNWVLTGFNYEHKYYRPGYILIEELLKEISRRGETYYNWYGYGRFYKSQWCNNQTPLYRLIMVRRSFKGGVYKMLSSAENVFRSNKIIVSAARRLRRS